VSDKIDVNGVEFGLDEQNRLHSTRVDVWKTLRGDDPATDRVEGAHRRFARLVKDFARAERNLGELFTRYERLQDELEEVGVVAEARLQPVIEAAYSSWRLHRDKPKRLELTQLSEPPIPPTE
jgi:hypothetical protein